jgi:ADP-ribose pyrophosphatase YjhB (NUDIX family)
MVEFVLSIPPGDNRERLSCPDCGFIAYENPKIVTGAVVVHAGKVLLCRRAIAPRVGFWTLPAGYMELGETVADAAIREALEEAEARIVLDGVLAIYSLSRIGQVQIIFRAGFADTQGGVPHIAAGPESAEVALFAWDEIPWDELAFPSVRWALRHWRAGADRMLGAPAGNPPEDPRGVQRLEAAAAP